MMTSRFPRVHAVAALIAAAGLLTVMALPLTAVAPGSPPSPTEQTSRRPEGAAAAAGQQFTVAAGATSPAVTDDNYSVTVPAPKRTAPVLSEASLATLVTGVGDDGKGYAYNPYSPGPVGWPFPDGAPISSSFGARHVADCAFCSTFHEGVDFDPAEGTPIHDIAGGTVRVAGLYDGYGDAVVIDSTVDGVTFETTYGHMIANSLTVKVGQKVGFSQVIGKVGATGNATGPHLHLGVSVNNAWVDPMTFIPTLIKKADHLPAGTPEPVTSNQPATPTPLTSHTGTPTPQK